MTGGRSSSLSLSGGVAARCRRRWAYNTAFHSCSSRMRSSLCKYSSTFVGREGSYSSSQSVSSGRPSTFFFLRRRPPRCRFSPAPAAPYRYSSSSVAAQSASVLRGGCAAVEEEAAVCCWWAGPVEGAAAGGWVFGTVLWKPGALGFALVCCGRRMGWKRRACRG